MNERTRTLQFLPAPSNLDRRDLIRRQERLLHYETLVQAGKMSADKAIHIVRCGDAAVSIAKHLKKLGLTRTEMLSILWDMIALLLGSGVWTRQVQGRINPRKAFVTELRAQKLH